MSIDKSEKILAHTLGGKLTTASGACFDNADIDYKDWIIECKRRDSNSINIVLYIKYWNKLQKQGIKHKKRIAYVYQTDNQNYFFINKYDAFELCKSWRIYPFINKAKTNIIITVENYNKCIEKLINNKKTNQNIGILINDFLIIDENTFINITNK